MQEVTGSIPVAAPSFICSLSSVVERRHRGRKVVGSSLRCRTDMKPANPKPKNPKNCPPAPLFARPCHVHPEIKSDPDLVRQYAPPENTSWDGVFQMITFSRLKNRVGGYNRAAPSFGYVGRVYGVTGAPNHAKLQLAAGLRRGHRSRQAAQDCGVIHCAGLPPPLCGAVTSPLSRDESA